jgi:hypothetical protein
VISDILNHTPIKQGQIESHFMVVIAHLVHRRTYFTFVTIRRVNLADLGILNSAIIYKIVVLERNQF